MESYIRRLQEVFTSHNELDFNVPLEVVIHILDRRRTDMLEQGYKAAKERRSLANKGPKDPSSSLEDIISQCFGGQLDSIIFEQENGIYEMELGEGYLFDQNIDQLLEDNGLQPPFIMDGNVKYPVYTSKNGNCFPESILQTLR